MVPSSTLAGHVPGDGGVLALAGDLVDLVDVDDAPLGPLHVEIRRLQELEDHVLHVLAHVARLGEGGGVGDGEGNVQHLGHGLGEEGLAAAGGADEQDVALLQLHIVLGGVEDALVVVVDRHRQHDLGPLLSDHIIVQASLDLHGLGQLLEDQGQPVVTVDRGGGRLAHLPDHAHTHAHALVADIAAVSRDQPVHHGLGLAAERAADASSIVRSCHMFLLCGNGTGFCPPRSVPIHTVADCQRL